MISSSQRPLPNNTQHSQQRDIHAPGGIRTHNLSRRAAADRRLRPRGFCDRRTLVIRELKLKIGLQFQLYFFFQVTKFRCRICHYFFSSSSCLTNKPAAIRQKFILEFLYVNFVLIHTVSVYKRPNLYKDKSIFSSFRQNHLSHFVCSVRRMSNEMLVRIIIYISMQRDTNGETNF